MIENPLAGLAGIVLAWLVGAQDPIQLAQDYGSGIPMVNQQPPAAAGATAFCDTHGPGEWCGDAEDSTCTADGGWTSAACTTAATDSLCNNTTQASLFSTYDASAGSEQYLGQNLYMGCFDATRTNGLCLQWLIACPSETYVTDQDLGRFYDSNVEAEIRSDAAEEFRMNVAANNDTNVDIDPGGVVTVYRMWLEFNSSEQVTDWWIQGSGNASKYGSWPESTSASTIRAIRGIGTDCWWDNILAEDLSDCCSSSNPPDEDGAGACT